jgi:acyl phosphate:glycerol-3-phosphate acyltransferase
MMSTTILIAVISYLLGSIPFGYLLVRAFRGTDIRQAGSGNIGATNVARTSPTLGIATLVLDALKGILAVLLGMYLVRRQLPWLASRSFWQLALHSGSRSLVVYWHAIIAAVFAVVGHVFPVWLKFRGGKGVATGLGAFLLLAPKSILVMIGIFLGVVALFRYVSLASILAVALFPLLAWLFREPKSTNALILIAVTSVLIVWKHRDNIVRLLNGNENRLQFRHK